MKKNLPRYRERKRLRTLIKTFSTHKNLELRYGTLNGLPNPIWGISLSALFDELVKSHMQVSA